MVPGNAPMKAAQVSKRDKQHYSMLLIPWLKTRSNNCSYALFFIRSLCPGECLVVGQSHFKTFDNKFFTFIGRCQYLLSRDCADNSFSVIIENVQVIWCMSSVSLLSFFLSQCVGFGCFVPVC